MIAITNLLCPGVNRLIIIALIGQARIFTIITAIIPDAGRGTMTIGISASFRFGIHFFLLNPQQRNRCATNEITVFGVFVRKAAHYRQILARPNVYDSREQVSRGLKKPFTGK